MPTQPLGWFKKPVHTVAEMQKLKYRTVGLAADLMKEMGVQVTIMGGPDIVPAMDRGVLDAAEFNNPSSDMALGFQDVAKYYMLQSFHQRMECFEIIFNKKKYESLPKDMQAILRVAAEAVSSDMSWKWEKRYPDDLDVLRKAGVHDLITPKPILAGAAERVEQGDRPALRRRVLQEGGRLAEGVGPPHRGLPPALGCAQRDGVRALLRQAEG